MKPKLIIPCLDTRNGKLVKGVRFRDVRDVGDPPEFAERYEKQGADELALLDITATPENRGTLLDVVRRTSRVISIPLTVGGGIRSVAEAKSVLDAGATRVSVNTAAVKRPELIRELSKEFGNESVICAIDGMKRKDGWEVYINGGMQPTGIDMIEWAKRAESLGAGGILYTGVHTDGTKDGYDINGTRAIAEAVNIPVIASGGAGSLEHIYRVLTDGKADAALAASIFHFEIYTIKEVKDYLKIMGVAVK